MKVLLAIYLIIGLLFTPFIYSNNAEDYRPGTAGTRAGSAIAGGIYWPSYLFSIEPEVDSSSFTSFQKSLTKMVEWRNDKLFTGTRTQQHGMMVMDAVGSCAALEGAGDIKNAYTMMLSADLKGEKIEKIRANLMKRMDGYDFLALVKEGDKCKQELIRNPPKDSISPAPATIISEKSPLISVPNIDGNCKNIDDVIKASGLKPKRVDVFGPNDIDAAGMGCAYRQSLKAGARVPEGTILEYRSWYESEGGEEGAINDKKQ